MECPTCKNTLIILENYENESRFCLNVGYYLKIPIRRTQHKFTINPEKEGKANG